MVNIVPEMLSKTYDVRRLNMDDADMIFGLCRKNTQYYGYCGKRLSMELIENDMKAAPPGIPMAQKYYVGFFDGDVLVAVMDLIDGYPDDRCAFIGFFMMNRDIQGNGIGSGIVAETLDYLRRLGILRCRLGIDKGNPQSGGFWRKNGFRVIAESAMGEGTVLVAEKQL